MSLPQPAAGAPGWASGSRLRRQASRRTVSSSSVRAPPLEARPAPRPRLSLSPVPTCAASLGAGPPVRGISLSPPRASRPVAFQPNTSGPEVGSPRGEALLGADETRQPASGSSRFPTAAAHKEDSEASSRLTLLAAPQRRRSPQAALRDPSHSTTSSPRVASPTSISSSRISPVRKPAPLRLVAKRSAGS